MLHFELLLRPALELLEKQLSKLEGDVTISVSFDGRALQFAGPVERVVVSASGVAWPIEFVLQPGVLRHPPHRTFRTEVCVSVTDGRLHIGRERYHGTSRPVMPDSTGKSDSESTTV